MVNTKSIKITYKGLKVRIASYRIFNTSEFKIMSEELKHIFSSIGINGMRDKFLKLARDFDDDLQDLSKDEMTARLEKLIADHSKTPFFLRQKCYSPTIFSEFFECDYLYGPRKYKPEADVNYTFDLNSGIFSNYGNDEEMRLCY